MPGLPSYFAMITGELELLAESQAQSETIAEGIKWEVWWAIMDTIGACSYLPHVSASFQEERSHRDN